jgi:DNA-binding XRE family transcriptional regulator
MPRLADPRNEKLMAARVNAGLTQGQLAEAVGLSRQIVNQYERLRASPSAKTGNRIARVLSLHTGEVLTYSDLFPLQRDAA